MLSKKSLAIIFTVILTATTIVAVAASQQPDDVGNENADISVTDIEYTDVSKTDWYYNDVLSVTNMDLMNGTSDTSFSPSENTTRAMLVTTLWRLEGKPNENDIAYDDVVIGEYYYDAVSWATKNNIVDGYDSKTFGPNDNATREQLITIMYRYAKYKNYDIRHDASLSAFSDADKISEYAVEPFMWGITNKIITGTSDSTLSPKDNTIRCQMAAILNRFCNNFVPETDEKEQPEPGEAENSSDSSDKKENSTSIKPSTGRGGGGGTSADNNSTPSSTEDPNNNEDIAVSDDALVLKMSVGYGKAGDTVSVTLDSQNNPGILGMVLTLEYDENAMKLMNVANGDAVCDVLSLTHSKTLSSPIRFIWDGVDLNSDDIKDGALLTLEFEISDSAQNGHQYPLTIKCNSGDIIDLDLTEVSPQIQNGYIEIE